MHKNAPATADHWVAEGQNASDDQTIGNCDVPMTCTIFYSVFLYILYSEMLDELTYGVPLENIIFNGVDGTIIENQKRLKVLLSY